MNTNYLKGAIRVAGMNQGEVANKIGCSLSRFNAKLNGRKGAEFLLSEVSALKKLLGLSSKDVMDIFFN